MFKKRDQQLLAEAYSNEVQAGMSSFSDDPNAITGKEKSTNDQNYDVRDMSLVTLSNIKNVMKNNNVSLARIGGGYSHTGIIDYLRIDKSQIPEGYGVYLLVKGLKGQLPTNVLGEFKYNDIDYFTIFLLPLDNFTNEKDMYILKQTISSPHGTKTLIQSIKQVYSAIDDTKSRKQEIKNQAKFGRDNVLGGPSFNPGTKPYRY